MTQVSASLFCVQSPGPARAGAVPRGTGSHYAHLGASRRAEARPHAQALRGSRLDVHTELPIVCVQRSRLDVHTELPIVCVQRSRLDVHTELPIVCVRGSLRSPI